MMMMMMIDLYNKSIIRLESRVIGDIDNHK